MKAKRIILHIGHQKTGTTTLQSTLVESRDYLRSKGIFHPQTEESSGNNSLLKGFLFGESFSNGYRLKKWNMDQEEAEIASERAWRLIVEQVKLDQPETILLCSETFFKPLRPAQIPVFTNALLEIAERIEIVAYIRSPQSFYLSSNQQWLKKIRKPRDPVSNRLRNVIEPFMKVKRSHLSLNVFEKSILKDGDIVNDFFSKYFPDVDISGLAPARMDKNTSLSAEAMALLKDLNVGRLGFDLDPHRASRAIIRSDRVVRGATRPKLFHHIKEAATNWSFNDLNWLRHQHGLVFPDVDYGSLRNDTSSKSLLSFESVEDICQVDSRRKKKILDRAISLLDPT